MSADRREARIREVMRQHVDHDSWEGDLCDDVPGDHKRWLLVERNQGHAQSHQPVYLSTHDSPRDAEEYHVTQEYIDDWHPIALVDLDTGEVHQIEVARTLEFDPPITPQLTHGLPLDITERQEDRPCAAKCGKPIQPGQLYIAKAPFHIGCAPKEVH